MSMRRAVPGDDPGRAPPKTEIAPHLRLGPVILSNERGGIIPLIVVGRFFFTL